MPEPPIPPATDQEIADLETRIGNVILWMRAEKMAARLIARIRQEQERVKERDEWRRLNEAAISVASFCNTPDSLEQNLLPRDNPYWSVAYMDVVTAMRREIALRAELAASREECERIRRALKRLGSMEAFDVGTVHVSEEVIKRIEYARAALGDKE